MRAGYDRMADRFGEWGAKVEGDPRDRFLAELTGLLAPSGRVLDLGCGSGALSTRRLAERFHVVGVDISAAQLERARRNVPAAELIHADVLDVDFPPASFDAAVALYSISHIPRQEHARLFSQVRRWLRPGGYFLASLGGGDIPAWTGEWLGVTMFFSSHSPAESRRLLSAAGLDPIRAEVISMREPEGEVSFLWVICRAVAQGG